MKRMSRVYRQNACADCATIPVAQCPSTTTINVAGQQVTSTYDVTLVGPTNSGLTWTYQVDQTAGQDLSHFSIQICGDIDPAAIQWEIRALADGTCGTLLDSGTGPDGDHFLFQAAGTGNPGDCLTVANVPYIKFDNLSDFAPVTDFCFIFTLPICLQVECICVGATTAGASSCACIQGPSSTCVPCEEEPVLTIDKECPEGIFRQGDTVTINIPVANTGTADAENVVVTDVINVPAGITIDNIMTTPAADTIVPPTGPYTNQDIIITWNLGTLVPDEFVLLTVTFDITEVTAAGVITNEEATATAANADTVTAGPCTVSVVPPGRGIKL